MSRPLLVLRPEPGNSRTCAKAQALGLTVIAAPLFSVTPLDWAARDASAYSGLLLTSANAIRCGGSGLPAYHGLPVFAVGAQSARAAQAAGFEVAHEGAGGVGAIMAHLPKSGRLLHLCGADVTAFETSLPVDQVAVYKSEALTPDSLDHWLDARPIALLHSVRAAQHFAALVAERSMIGVAAYSAAVATAVGIGWESLAVAANPRDEDLLAVAQQLAGMTRR
jgi:uroporphyrinogen-III synthase